MMGDYIATMQQSHNQPTADLQAFRHISDWLNAIDNASSDYIPNDLLTKARQLKNDLLRTMGTPLFLHGDLHLDTIVASGKQWLCIDPKGIVGDAELN